MTTTIIPIISGIATNFLAVPIDSMMHAMGFFPPIPQRMSDAMFLVPFAYRLALTILGGYVAAYVSQPNEGLSNAKLLGTIGIFMSSAGTYAAWDLGPHWYALGIIAVSYPGTLLGGKIYTGE